MSDHHRLGPRPVTLFGRARVDIRLGRGVRVRTRTDATFVLAVAALVIGILACIPPIIRAARGQR